MLYDTHAHLNLAAFSDEVSEVIVRAQEERVLINNIGTQKDTSVRAVEIAEKYDGVYAVVGLHPAHTVFAGDDESEGVFEKPESEFDIEFYSALAKSSKVVGVGECGLDYYRIPEGMTKDQVAEIQSKAFKAQIDLAYKLNKALVIHCRASKGTFDAYDDVLKILGSYQSLPRFEIHSFTANWEYCQKFLFLGGYIALNGIITFDKTGTLLEVVEHCPLDRIILETDSPYLAPAPFRGKRNEPGYLRYMAQYIAEKRGLAQKDVALLTTDNAKKLFHV